MKMENEVLDILNKWEFFYGQRAGRELWADKPKEVQDKDIADFNRDIQIVRTAIEQESLRQTGQWVHDGRRIRNGVDWYHCSKCGNNETGAALTNYCPNCGCQMVGAE